MTGFGHASAAFDGGTIELEIRSVNSRFLDLSFKLSDELRNHETSLRDKLSVAFARGKIELRGTINRPNQRPSDAAAIAPEALAELAAAQNSLLAQFPNATPLSVAELFSWVERRSHTPATPDAVRAAADTACEKAVDELRIAREREGAKMADALMQRVDGLAVLAALAVPLVPQVVELQRQKFVAKFELAWAQAQPGVELPQAAQERAAAEASAYALRIDVAEELARLQAHLSEITHLLKTGGELGKRLEFLIQELHRECNTLGAKSSTLELTRISVDMKVLVEQMREQVQNIA